MVYLGTLLPDLFRQRNQENGPEKEIWKNLATSFTLVEPIFQNSEEHSSIIYQFFVQINSFFQLELANSIILA